jgi:hypothetical protein
MKTRNMIQRILAMTALVVALAVAVTATFPAQAQRQDAMQAEAQSSGGAAYSSGLISLAPGQRVRVSAVNVGGKGVTLNFGIVFVNEQGKIAGLVVCPDAVASPGNAATDEFKHPGGANIVQL